MSEARKKVVQRIARQIATFEGYTFQVAPNAQQVKKEATYRTLAEGILATVERAALAIRWKDDDGGTA